MLREEQGPLLPRKDLLHVLGAGEGPLITDYYWLAMIQQMGRAISFNEYRDIYDYANLVTDLDPKFRLAYYYAGVTVPVRGQREKWRNTAESDAIIRKGIGQLPRDYRMNLLLAYNLQTFDKDYLGAAQVLQYTATLPGAPSYLPKLATRLFAQSGQVDAGLVLARAMRANATTDEERKFYENRILQLEQEAVLQAVDKAAADFRAKEGRVPRSVDELLQGGFLPRAPLDPMGGKIGIRADGESFSSVEDRRLRIYEDPNDAAAR
jgi:hypothetical protein